MKKLLYFTLALLATACVKDATMDLDPNSDSRFRAEIMPVTTKTQMDASGMQKWTADDRISIFASTANIEYRFDGATGDRQGTFSKVGDTAAGTALSANYGVYPYSPSTSILADGTVSLVLPSVQFLEEGTFGLGANVMTAVTASSSDRNLKFKNACGYLVLNLYAADFTMKELRFRGNNQESICGDATVTFDSNKNPNLAVNSACNYEITLASESGLKLGTSSSAATKIWVVLPPVTFSKGFTVEMVDKDGRCLTKTTEKAVAIARNEIVDMKNLDVDSCPSTEFKHITARWEFNSSKAKAASTKWINENRIFANCEDGSGTAYISLEAGSAENIPARVLDGNYLAAGNLTTGNAFEITYPGVTAAKGSTVDFMWSMYSISGSVPKYWIFEYLEGGEWKCVEEDLHTAEEDSSIKYSLLYYSSDAQKTNFVQSFTLSQDVNNGDIKVRLRAVGKYNASGSNLTPTAGALLYIANYAWTACEMDIYQGCAVRDLKKILVLGNSFTQYQSTNFMLKRIARSQGHEIRMRPFMKGGQYFRNFLTLKLAQLPINEGGYEYALLQDQSGQHARYYSDPVANAAVLTETKQLVDQIKAKSPSVYPILENTWAFLGASDYEGYGSMEAFDAALQCGALAVSKGAGAEMSPIGVAFQKAREAGVTNLYYTDNKHPGRPGGYLKSCVNYLMIYGQKFDSNVPDCDVEPALAAKLRGIAEDVVLGGYEIKYFVVSQPTKSSFGIEGGTGYSDIDTNLTFEVSCPETWLTVEKQADRVSWNVSANSAKGSRSAVITLTPSYGSVKTITIGQSGTDVPGGISNKAEFLDFANLVNTGADFGKYKDANGDVILKEDIDLEGETWTPIGNSTSSIAYGVNTAPTAPFKGVFDGKGHKIKNLSVKIMNNATTYMGLFGATQDSEIRNLILENATMEMTTTGIASNNVAFGCVVGFGYNTKFSHVTVNVTSTGKATSTAERMVSYGGIVGILYASAEHLAGVDYCTVNGEFTNDIGAKYSNSNTVQFGGILGAVSLKSELVRINFCTNNANFTVKGHRCGGIIGNAFKSEINNCNNYGNIDINYSANKKGTLSGVRTGGIMAYCSTTTVNPSNLLGCTNYGTISTVEEGSAVGGVAGLIRCYTLRECHNQGNIIGPVPSPSGPYRGLLVGAITSADSPSTFERCSLRGKIGAKMDMSDAVESNEDNYLELGVTIASGVSCPSWNAENIMYVTEQ